MPPRHRKYYFLTILFLHIYWPSNAFPEDLCYKYTDQKKYDLAIQACTEIIQKKPDPAAFNNRGIAYYESSSLVLAILDYDKAIELDPEEPSYYYNRGIIHFDRGDFDKAIEDYSKAIELNPNDRSYYKKRAKAYKEKGDYVKYMADLRKEMELLRRRVNGN